MRRLSVGVAIVVLIGTQLPQDATASTLPAFAAPSSPADAAGWSQFGLVAGINRVVTASSDLTPDSAQYLSERWASSASNGVDSSPAVADGAVYIGTTNPHGNSDIIAVDAASGIRLWSHPTAAAVQSSPAVDGGLVYAGDNSGMLYALSAATGAVAWSLQTSGFILSSPTVADHVLYVTSGREVYALDDTTGAAVWTSEIPFSDGYVEWSSAAVSDGHVYVDTISAGTDSQGGEVLALDAATGALIWTHSDSGGIVGSPATADGLVFFGTDANTVSALDAVTGAVEWTYAGTSYVQSTPVIAGGFAYVEFADGTVTALDEHSGAIIWAVRPGSYGFSSPALVNGLLFVGDGDSLFAVDASTGATSWSHLTAGGVSSSPSIVGDDVYVGSDDDHLYAFSLPSPSVSLAATVLAQVGNQPSVSLTGEVVPAGLAGSVTLEDTITAADGTSTEVTAGAAYDAVTGIYTAALPGDAGAHAITASFATDPSEHYWPSSSATVQLSVASTGCNDTLSACTDSQNLVAQVPAGVLSISTPYTASSPLKLGTLGLNSAGDAFTASAQFGDSATDATQDILITDTRAGNLPWTAQAQATNLTDGGTNPGSSISGENVGLTALTVVPVTGNGFNTASANLTTAANPAANPPAAPGDAGYAGLGNEAHDFAQAQQGIGSVGLRGTLTLNAPSSTEAGQFTGTVTFTVVGSIV